MARRDAAAKQVRVFDYFLAPVGADAGESYYAGVLVIETAGRARSGKVVGVHPRAGFRPIKVGEVVGPVNEKRIGSLLREGRGRGWRSVVTELDLPKASGVPSHRAK